MTTSLNDMLQDLVDQLPGCLHTSVIDGQTGLAMASVSGVDSLDGAGTDAYHNDLYRLSHSALEGTPISGEVNEIVLTSGDATYVSRPIEKTGYLWLVVTDRDTTVGFVQALMRKQIQKIEESLQVFVD